MTDVEISVRRSRGRQHDTNAAVGESASHCTAPLPIAIAEHAMPSQQAMTIEAAYFESCAFISSLLLTTGRAQDAKSEAE